ncbi:hypothetical protein [Meiothermus sp. CFH 77666]|nr:hypothetical protein [Meiothermus sp. CFH 77666]MBO1438323.1 hypothetical protein [Meiothermus sp. CFH 77666]
MIVLGLLWLFIIVLLSIFPEHQWLQTVLLTVAAIAIALWIAIALAALRR